MAEGKNLQIKRGIVSTIGTLMAGEVGWATDTEVLYVGNGAANKAVLMGSQASAAGLALLDDANAAAQRVTLGGVALFNCGSYTGNGTRSRAIAIGFQPKLVRVWSSSNANYSARIDVTNGQYLLIGVSEYLGGAAPGLGLTATGFVTESDDGGAFSCNANAIVYRWEAWG